MSKTYTVDVIEKSEDGVESTILSVQGTASLTALNLRATADELAPRAKPGRKAKEPAAAGATS